MSKWNPIETAPRDGSHLLMTDGHSIHVCYLKLYPRPLSLDDDMSQSMAGDVWEYFRDQENAPGHSWSMIPTRWMSLPAMPESDA
jgi:hypothetical protein